MTVIHTTPLDLAGARVEGLKRLPFEKGLLEGVGTLESPVIEAAFPFGDLVASWNAQVPEGAAVELQVQVRVDGTWTKWFRMSRWQPGAPKSLGRQEDLWGAVDVDTLKLRGKADAFRYRVKLEASKKLKARLTRVAVAYSDSTAPFRPSPPFAPGPWVRELEVAPRSQMEEQEQYKHDICSPTSLAVVLEFWGRRMETLEVAQAVQDREEGIYGNWPLNVAAAGAWGLSGQVARLSSLDDLQAEIAAGRPTIVSISFANGELTGAPIKKTLGHLLVVTGFSKEGDVIVNDPAAPDRFSARRVYRRAEFEKAWLANKRGLAYVLSQRFPDTYAVGVPTADLRAKPSSPRRANAADTAMSSQLLYGERVRALEAKGDWVRVAALEQPKEGSDLGYPGWVRAEELRMPPVPYRPDAVVRAKRADVFWRDAGGREQSMTLPIGSLLTSVSTSVYDAARMLDGRLVRTPAGTMSSLHGLAGRPADRRDILETAAMFLGDRYVWGGRSSQQKRAGWGVDCSGLTHLAYRAVGVTLPRDAQDQYLSARKIPRSKLQPGDLVFLTDPADLKQVNHVMLYTGGDGLLESRESAGKTIRTTFEERFGTPLSALESGDTVTDLTRKAPAKRKIHFGSYLAP